MEISIITINFNNKEGLQKTIDSVMAQTWKYFEWVIIDGGSTDGSKELILEYQSSFSFWCSEPDRGIYNAMNKGVTKATGDYLLFLNSGDVFYDDDVLNKIHALGMKSDIVSGQMVRMDNGQLLRTYDKDILMQLVNWTINHQATFIRRSLLEEIKYDESLKIVADWKFWLEAIVFHQCSFEVLDLYVSKQDMTGISYSQEHKALHQAERKKVLEELFPPLVLNTLQNYTTYRNQPENRNLSYLKEKRPVLFSVFKKLISFSVRVNRKSPKN